MQTVLIVIHLIIVLALVVVVLLQRSEGGALGMGGGGGGGLMTARGAANVLTRTTAILATMFFITSMALGILARYGGSPLDILDRVPTEQGAAGGGTSGAAPASGSLLDQLGGLSDTGTADAPVDVPSGATPATPNGGTTSVAPTAVQPSSEGVPIGGAAATPVREIPANPAPEAPNAPQQPTVPAVEAPPAGSTAPTEAPASSSAPDAPEVSPGTTGTAPAQPAQ